MVHVYIVHTHVWIWTIIWKYGNGFADIINWFLYCRVILFDDMNVANSYVYTQPILNNIRVFNIWPHMYTTVM